jgi:TonB family protein
LPIRFISLSLACALQLCGLVACSAAAAEGLGLPAADGGSNAPPHNPIDFNIPAQPLAAALNRYASLSSRPALFSSEIVAGRTSSAVLGRYAPEAALQHLLEGTGIVAEKVADGPSDAFVLKEVSAQIAIPPATPVAGDGYSALIQAGIWQALCSNPGTAPGAYRALLRFQVNAAGGIQAAQLLGSTGNSRRDATLLESVRQVRIDLAPPPDVVQQPLTMIILPGDPHAGPHCSVN